MGKSSYSRVFKYVTQLKNIHIGDRNIPYTLKISPRTRHLRLVVYPGGDFVVTAPKNFQLNTIENFIKKKSQWIIRAIDRMSHFAKPILKKRRTKADFLKHKGVAEKIVKERLEYFNSTYHFSYNKITVRNQKTRWGSCSRKGNLNFNYKIALLPEKLADYIIVHELCHLGEFNHSKKFWNLVEQTVPYYKNARAELQKNGLQFY